MLKGICEVPGNLLNNSLYRVRVLLVKDAVDRLLSLDTVMFEVHDVERSVAYYGRWGGAVRPMLSWRTEVEAAEAVETTA